MNLDSLIADNNNWKNGAGILSQFLDTEVFFNILGADEKLKSGEMTVTNTNHLGMPTAKLENGEMAIFYTTNMDARLNKPFGGVSLQVALNMALANDDIDGILLQSNSSAWISISKIEIRNLNLATGADKRRFVKR